MINYSLVVFFLAPAYHLSAPRSKTRKLLNVFNMVVVNFPNDDCVSDSGTRGVSVRYCQICHPGLCRCVLHGYWVLPAGRGGGRGLRHGLWSMLHLQRGVRGRVPGQQHILLRGDQHRLLALLLQGNQTVYGRDGEILSWHLTDVSELPRHLPVAAQLRDVLCLRAELPSVCRLPGHGPHPVSHRPVLRPFRSGAPASAVRD